MSLTPLTMRVAATFVVPDQKREQLALGDQLPNGLRFKLEFDEQQQRWLAEIDPVADGSWFTIPLENQDYEQLLEAETELLELLAAAAPELSTFDRALETPRSVIYPDASGCYWLHQPCEECGGFAIQLPLSATVAHAFGGMLSELMGQLTLELEQELLRHLAAQARLYADAPARGFTEAAADGMCLGCLGQAIEDGECQIDSGAPWFDVQRSIWLVKVPLGEDEDEQMTVPLPELTSFFVDPNEVQAAVYRLLGRGRR